MVPQRTTIAYGITTIGATATRIVTQNLDNYTAKDMLIISDSGNGPNTNVTDIVIAIGDSEITSNGPGIRKNASWGAGDAFPGHLDALSLYAACSTPGQKIMYWVYG